MIPGGSRGESPSPPDVELGPTNTYTGFVPGQWNYANLENPDPNANLSWELPPLRSPGPGDDLDDAWLSAENVSNSPKADGENLPDSHKRKTPPTENLFNAPKRRMHHAGATDFEARYGIPWDPRPYIDPNANQEQPSSPNTIVAQPARSSSGRTSVSSKRKPSNSSEPASDVTVDD